MSEFYKNLKKPLCVFQLKLKSSCFIYTHLCLSSDLGISRIVWSHEITKLVKMHKVARGKEHCCYRLIFPDMVTKYLATYST